MDSIMYSHKYICPCRKQGFPTCKLLFWVSISYEINMIRDKNTIQFVFMLALTLESNKVKQFNLTNGILLTLSITLLTFSF